MLVIETIPITNPTDEVTDDATRCFCAAGLSGFPVFFRQIAAPQGAGLGTPVGGLSAISPSSSSAAERSLVVGMDVAALGRLAGSTGLRAASYGHSLAREAIPGPLEPIEPRRQGRPPSVAIARSVSLAAHREGQGHSCGYIILSR